MSRVGRMDGFFGELAEFPEDDYSQVNFWLSKIRKIDVEGGGMRTLGASGAAFC